MKPQCSRTTFRTQTGTFKEAATNNNHTNMQKYTKTVTAYIKKCTDNVTVTKTPPHVPTRSHGLQQRSVDY